MNKKTIKGYKNNVHFYFKDAYIITFLIIGFFLLGFILTLFNGKAWTHWNLILLILAFALPIFELPMIVFYFKVLHDFKQNYISEKEITVQKIYTNIDLIIPVPNRWILKKRYLEAKRKESV